MKIYVVGSNKNKFLPLDNIREKFLIDKPHEGDNIDNLNPWYCELTGLYYLWKHVDDDIVGLEHYRRYFGNNKNVLLNEKEITKLLSQNDIICVKAQYSQYRPVKTWLINHKKYEEMIKFITFLKCYVSPKYANACMAVLESDYHTCCNMMICKKEVLDKYCTFIFDALFNYQAAEKRFGRELPKRIMGYFTEFSFDAWARLNNKKIFYTRMKWVP